MKSVLPLFLVFFIFGAQTSFGAQRSSIFKNAASLKRIYNFPKISSQKIERKLKVAVLDKGFLGFKKEIGKSLPANTKYFAGPIQSPNDSKVDHGLKMAQILTEFAGEDAFVELQLHNVYGFSNFKAAIKSIIADKVDLVLYSEVWEFGSNFDGEGFINAEVQKALDAGITWVNAAGNVGKTTFNSEIKTGDEDWLILPDQNKSLKVICQKKNSNANGKKEQESKCPIRIVLSWNDFKDTENIGTDKDLDLALTDDLLGIVQTSRLKQSRSLETKAGESKYPREIITAEIKPGTYFIRVKNSSKNFNAEDRLRITVDGEFLTVPSADQNESLLNPADLEGVITVGAIDSERSSVSKELARPEFWVLSSLVLNDDKEFKGSSNSAAILAAAISLMLSRDQALSAEDALSQITHEINWGPRGLSLNQLYFRPINSRCFVESFPDQLPEHLQLMLARGAKFVETTASFRLMTPYDPISLTSQLARQRLDDLVLITPQGMKTQNRFQATAQDAVEVFQTPLDTGLCYLPITTYRVLGF